MDFFSQPTNLALIATAVGSGLMLLYTGINGRNISQLSPAQATQLINKRAQILDLRSVEQFAAGHVLNAKSLPFAGLKEQLGLLKLKKDKPVLLICERGAIASKAVAALTAAEFTDVHVLEGGLKAWREAQLPLVK
ncbi:MAG: rhodanese-like domain-containing protein [Formosimonas sp.]